MSTSIGQLLCRKWVSDADSSDIINMTIIGITGPNGSGKGAVVHLLKERGFIHLSVRSFLTHIIDSQEGGKVTREALIDAANDLRRRHGADYIMRKLLLEANASMCPAIVESIRTTAEVEALRAAGGFLLAIDAPRNVRFARIQARASETDAVTWSEFVRCEEREWRADQPDNPHEQNIRACVAAADALLVNNGSLAELREKITELLKQ